jgi:arylsulfatase A-like enzyme
MMIFGHRFIVTCNSKGVPHVTRSFSRFLLLLVICWYSAAMVAADEPNVRPNIVLIVADDLGWGELGCYGQEKIRTPNIDRLAAQGMRFTQHYSGAPVCAPARCVLMTGLHTGHAAIRGNREARDSQGQPAEGQQPIPDEALTIAEVLKQAGYATGAAGKWGLGIPGTTGDPNRQGFDFFYGYACQRMAHSYFPPHLWRNQERVTINERPIPGHATRAEGPVTMEEWVGENYAPDLMEREALKYIDDHASEPFFLYLPFIEAHLAMHPPRRLVESYPESWDTEPYRGQCGYLPHPRPRAGYAAMITHLDEHVGRVMQRLEKHGLSERTFVLFTSDNGTTHRRAHPLFGVGGVDAEFFNSTRGLREFKGSVHEGGIRVPLIVRWPGRVAPGSTSDFPAHFVDHFATLCDLLKLDVPGRRDGVSLLPILTSKGDPPLRNPLVWVFPEYRGQVAVRIGDFKAVRKNLAQRKPGEWEVYNIARDPSESSNIADDHPEVIREAIEILKTQMDDNPLFPVRVPGVNT